MNRAAQREAALTVTDTSARFNFEDVVGKLNTLSQRYTHAEFFSKMPSCVEDAVKCGV